MTVLINELIEEVVRFRTTDGKLYTTKQEATSHQNAIQQAEEATKQLRDGLAVAQILHNVGYVGEIDPILENVTKNSRFVISYWQCCVEAVYSPVLFHTGMSVYVEGDSSQWGGEYGNKMSIEEMVGYAKHQNSIL